MVRRIEVTGTIISQELSQPPWDDNSPAQLRVRPLSPIYG